VFEVNMVRAFDFTHAILRRPGASAVKGLRANGGPDPDFTGLLAEHAAYAAALAATGLAVAMLDPLESHPDSLFVEDPALVFPEGAILLRPGAPSRKDEGESLRADLNSRFDQVLELDEGHADGGDVLVMPDRVFIGLSARTDRKGAEGLARLFDQLGYKAEIAETPPEVLHLKTASSLIDEETVLATAALAASGIFASYRVIEVPSGAEGGANVLRVRDTLLVGQGHPAIVDLLDGRGAEVVTLANREIARIDAGLTCMSLRWRAADGP
jgi:dimethylargininase